ncbi:translation initiation factor eIF-2B [Natronomonas sp. F2-12]|uniref:Translation initiation factor eIF-2B n=1 Tax=Natronomonas aquatica TaxID=2841590 RepID=A0A9R1CP77_9EURY|nr:translation initiation factor eIF-2B [Natronomonas aquatica]MCQ4332479.1 translation initiation factor eIF-2B [Natronomonas aquatica]
MIDETAAEIREMRTHSSSVVAVKAAEALRELLDRDFATVEEYARSLERNSNALRRAQPSHASLYNTQREIVARVTDGDFGTIEAAKAETEAAIDDVVESVNAAKHGAAENAVELLPDGATVLTHDYSSTVVEAIELAASGGNHIDVYVTEARPRFLGRKTARRLGEIDRVDATLVVDSAAGLHLDDCDRVLLGMSAIVDETLYNRIGTFPIAVTAAELAVPVSVVGASEKRVDGGFVFENESRPSAEVMREPAEGFSVSNPAYDATPTRLLENVVTEDGIEKLE